MVKKFGPLGPTFYTPAKVAPTSLYINFRVSVRSSRC